MSMFKPRAVALLVALAFASAAAFAADSPHLGKPVSEADIKAWDISVLPDGSNLPPGSGTPAKAQNSMSTRAATNATATTARAARAICWSAIRR